MSSRYRVPSVERAFRLLGIIQDSENGLSLAELVSASGFPKTTVYTILETLRTLDAVYERNGRFYLGIRLMELGGAAAEGLDLKEAARPAMEWLQDQTGFAVHLAVLHGDEVVFLDKLESKGFIRFSSYIGMTAPFYVTSLGKALVACLPETARNRLITTCELRPRTPHTIVDREQLSAALDSVRQHGYAIEDEEQDQGVRCVGAPIFGDPEDVVAAISVTAISNQLPADRFPEIGALVRRAADQVSHTLGNTRAFLPSL